MYKKKSFSSILIVKMSSLGDIIQAFSVLDYLHAAFPHASIDWVTEETFAPLVAAHPFVRKAVAINVKELKKGWRKFFLWKKFFHLLKNLRKERYDILFDLQGNCKSALITCLSRVGIKVGFGLQSVREKPNILSTHVRFNVDLGLNIREQYVELVRKFFRTEKKIEPEIKAILSISLQEKGQIEKIFASPCLQTHFRMMVCPGSQWINKQIPLETWLQFLKRLKEKLDVSFLFAWGSDIEKKHCESLNRHFEKSLILDKLLFPVWQNVMEKTDVVIAVDSSALHLCGMTKTPSFSVFGPTSSKIFKPIGAHHFAFQGRCPYDKRFEKMCPLLRTCPTGACMKNLDAEEMAQAFFKWYTAPTQVV